MRLLLKSRTARRSYSRLRCAKSLTRLANSVPDLFDKILPLLTERTLEDQERHFLVKVIDCVLYKLDDLVWPYVHKILAIIEPILIDEDYSARVEGREILYNLSKRPALHA